MRKCAVRNFMFLTDSLKKVPVRTYIVHKESSETNLNKKTKTNNGHFQQYTTEQQSQILHQLNALNLEEFQSYVITKGRASKLVAWKNRNGPLKVIEDIQSIDGFAPKIVEKFFESLLHGPKSEQTKKVAIPRIASYITPSIDAKQRNKIQSCISLRIGVSSVTWSRLELPPDDLNEPCILTDWQHHEIAEKKLHLIDLVKRCLYIDELIPKADCYIFENPQTVQNVTNPGSADQQNISIQKSQMAAILSFAMAKRFDMEATQVFYLRRFLSARLFNHLVGNERVSSEETVKLMMRTHYNVDGDVITETMTESVPKSNSRKDSLRRNVEFSSDLRQMFAHAERYHREFLGQALLMNLTFVRLVLLEDPKSIAGVTRQTHKDKKITLE